MAARAEAGDTLTMAHDISVVIPVRNGALHVREAIQSCLDQTTPVREIIVVDDGSQDATADIVAELGAPVVLLRQTWSGAAAAMNAGVAHAKGALLAFLDHDDIWRPEKLTVQMAEFAHRPDREAIFGGMQQFISPEVDAALRVRLRCPAEPQPGLAASVMLIHRMALERHGAFHGGRNAVGFMGWFMRAKADGLRFSIARDVVALRRLHAANSSFHDRDVNRQQYLDVSREMILRHRRIKSNIP